MTHGLGKFVEAGRMLNRLAFNSKLCVVLFVKDVKLDHSKDLLL